MFTTLKEGTMTAAQPQFLLNPRISAYLARPAILRAVSYTLRCTACFAISICRPVAEFWLARSKMSRDEFVGQIREKLREHALEGELKTGLGRFQRDAGLSAAGRAQHRKLPKMART